MPGHDGIYVRTDIRLQNDRGMALECSHWEPAPAERPSQQMPCVIFLHGNCSSRCEGMELCAHLLPLGITVFCFDFSGSGLSGGEYVSLSYFEKEDLRIVIQHLRSTGTVAGIGLWGRSMGAATAVFHASVDPEIHACILDSPFADLKEVATELVDRGRFMVPGFIISMALELIRSEVQSRAEFDLNECMPVSVAHKATCPALFATAYDDDFVRPHHTRDLYEIWGGRAELVDFDGGHNGERPAWFLHKACAFLLQCFNNPREHPRPRGPDALRTSLKQPASEGTSPNVSLLVAHGSLPGNDEQGTPANPLVPLPKLNPAATALRDKVMAMGFPADSATAAAQRCSSVEACIDWIKKQFEDAVANIEGATLRPPATSRTRQPGDSTGVEAPRSTPVGNDLNPPTTSSGRGKLEPWQIATELQNLGFSSDEAKEAVRRCSSVEAGLDWIERQRGVAPVH